MPIWMPGELGHTLCDCCGRRYGSSPDDMPIGPTMWRWHRFTCKHEIRATCSDCAKMEPSRACSVCGCGEEYC